MQVVLKLFYTKHRFTSRFSNSPNTPPYIVPLFKERYANIFKWILNNWATYMYMWHKKQNTISFSIVNFFFFYPKYLIPLFHHLVSNCVNIKSWASNFFFFTISYFFTTVRKIKAIFLQHLRVVLLTILGIFFSYQ